MPLDLSDDLRTEGPATSSGLVANFIRINAGEHVKTAPNATSELYYVLDGRGFSVVDGSMIVWE